MSWRAGFYINVPIGIAMIIAAFRFISETPRTTGRFDLPGAMTSTLGMGALVYGIVHSADAGWSVPATIVPIALGLLLLGAMVVNEWRAPQPIMPLRLFANRERSGAVIARLLFAGTMIAFFFFTTQFLQGVYHYSPLQAGLAFLPMTIVQFAVAITVPRLTHRFGNAPLLAVGLALVAVGMAWMTQLTPATPYLAGVALPMLLIGVGQGLGFGPLTAAGIAGVTAKDAGAASGLVNTAHQLGSTLGVGILVAASAGAATLAHRVSDAYLGGTIMLLIALVATLALIVPGERSLRAATSPAIPEQSQGGHA